MIMNYVERIKRMGSMVRTACRSGDTIILEKDDIAMVIRKDQMELHLPAREDEDPATPSEIILVAFLSLVQRKDKDIIDILDKEVKRLMDTVEKDDEK